MALLPGTTAHCVQASRTMYSRMTSHGASTFEPRGINGPIFTKGSCGAGGMNGPLITNYLKIQQLEASDSITRTGPILNNYTPAWARMEGEETVVMGEFGSYSSGEQVQKLFQPAKEPAPQKPLYRSKHGFAAVTGSTFALHPSHSGGIDNLVGHATARQACTWEARLNDSTFRSSPRPRPPSARSQSARQGRTQRSSPRQNVNVSGPSLAAEGTRVVAQNGVPGDQRRASQAVSAPIKCAKVACETDLRPSVATARSSRSQGQSDVSRRLRPASAGGGSAKGRRHAKVPQVAAKETKLMAVRRALHHPGGGVRPRQGTQQPLLSAAGDDAPLRGTDIMEADAAVAAANGLTPPSPPLPGDQLCPGADSQASETHGRPVEVQTAHAGGEGPDIAAEPGIAGAGSSAGLGGGGAADAADAPDAVGLRNSGGAAPPRLEDACMPATLAEKSKALSHRQDTHAHRYTNGIRPFSTMGRITSSDPNDFLRKGHGAVAAPTSMAAPGTPHACATRKPFLPDRHDPPARHPPTLKNFVLTNATENILGMTASKARSGVQKDTIGSPNLTAGQGTSSTLLSQSGRQHPTPARGSRSAWESPRKQPTSSSHVRLHRDFGRVPAYLSRRRHEQQNSLQERLAWQQQLEAQAPDQTTVLALREALAAFSPRALNDLMHEQQMRDQSSSSELPQDLRGELLARLEERQSNLGHEYATLPVRCDTLVRINHKESIEAQLDELDKNIKLLRQERPIVVHNTPRA
eukprot:Rmarinus@m.3509